MCGAENRSPAVRREEEGSHGTHLPWRSKVNSSQHLVRIKQRHTDLRFGLHCHDLPLTKVCVCYLCRLSHLSRQEVESANGRAAGEEAESAGTAECTIG